MNKLVHCKGEQALTLWPLIRYAVINSYPQHIPYKPEIVTNIQTAILNERLDCWGLVSISKESYHYKALAITSIIYDELFEVGFMTLYTLYAFTPVSVKEWKLCLEALKKHAARHNCHAIVAVTENKRINSLVERLGGTKISYLQLGVN